MPYVISHENAMQAVVAALKPTRFDHSPRSVRDDFSYSKAFVLEGSRKLVLIPVYNHDNHGRGYPGAALLHWFWLRLSNGWGPVRRLIGRRWCNRFRSRRHRLFKRYQRIPSDRLSDLCHDLPTRIASATIVHENLRHFTGAGRSRPRFPAATRQYDPCSSHPLHKCHVWRKSTLAHKKGPSAT